MVPENTRYSIRETSNEFRSDRYTRRPFESSLGRSLFVRPTAEPVDRYEGRQPRDERASFPRTSAKLQYQIRQDLIKGVGEPFDGSPCLFWNWQQFLTFKIVDAEPNAAEELQILLGNTRGRPREIVQQAMMGTNINYEHAVAYVWKTLREQYGSETAIFSYLMEKLVKSPKIRSHTQTREMEDLYLLTSSIRQSIPQCTDLKIMELAQGLQQIWERMPDEFIKRWRTEVSKIDDRFRDTIPAPLIERLLSAMESYIRECKNPMFQPITSRTPSLRTFASSVVTHDQNDEPPPSGRGSRTEQRYSDRPRTRKPMCALHKDSTAHNTSQCEGFRRLRVEERYRLIRETGLCFRCLGPHFGYECDKPTPCEVCRGQHHALLHRGPYDAANREVGSRRPHQPGAQPTSTVPQVHQDPSNLKALQSRMTPSHPPRETWETPSPYEPLSGTITGPRGPDTSTNWRERPTGPSSERAGTSAILNPYDPRTAEGHTTETVDGISGQPQTTGTTLRTLRTGREESRRRTCSKTVPVLIRASNGNLAECYAILDEQSNQTFVDDSLIERLQIPMTDRTEEEYTMTTLARFSSKFTGVRVNNLAIRGLNKNQWIELPSVLTHPGLPDTRDEISGPELVAQLPHVANFASHFPPVNQRLPVAILVGTDCGEAMRTTCHGQHFPFVHDTALGWALVGPIDPQARHGARSKVLLSGCSTPVDLSSGCHREHIHAVRLSIPALKDVFARTKDDEMLDSSAEDKQFLELMESSVRRNEAGSLELPLPLKEGAMLPRNKMAVYMRSRNTLGRVAKNPELAIQCRDIMGKYLERGHVDQLSAPLNLKHQSSAECYSPVFPVVNKEKVRVVFDSSAKHEGRSLNDCLYRGPDVANKLLGVLLRFRTHKVGFVADVEAMFHAFYVEPTHRDALRFFWWDQNAIGGNLKVFRANVHVFGNRSSPAIATYALRQTTKGEDAERFPEACEYIRRNFYVDDGLGTAESVEASIKILQDARSLLAPYNVRLCKIVSNRREVTAVFPHTELAEVKSEVPLTSHPSQSTLGISWNLEEDSLGLRFQVTAKPFNKRGLLSVVGTLYDPMGLIAPITLWGRLLQREILSGVSTAATASLDWDDPLPDKWRRDWFLWMETLPSAKNIRVPRCFHPTDFGRVATSELHIFCDASAKAIGLVIYLRQRDHTGRVSVGLVFGAARVAPRAATSIPRLELCAAVEAARAAQKIRSELDITIDRTVWYSDSRIVLGYLTNKKREFQRYVTSRVGLILQLSEAKDWRYIPTEDNPADLASRPQTPERLEASCWVSGPEFLRRPEFDRSTTPPPTDFELPETMIDEVRNVRGLITCQSGPAPLEVCSRRYECWEKTRKLTALVLRAAAEFKKALLPRDEALQRSDTLLYIEAQRSEFRETYQRLVEGQPLRLNDPLLPLDPFLDERGVIRVGGRLSRAPLPYEERHPVLLPRDHPVTIGIWIYCHRLGRHQGRHITNAVLRRKGFFIHRAKVMVGRFLRECTTCQRLRGKCQGQKMSDLPVDRLEKVPPFTNTGLDVFGPFVVHDGKTTRNTRGSKKVWVLICVCLVSRAVHLELLSSLDTSALQLALRRFQSIRGTCKRMRSDQGTNFMGACNQNEGSVTFKEFQKAAEATGCIWEMPPPYASHFAGVWERKVASVKHVMRSTLATMANANFSREELSTWIQEAACIVNSTPLGEISDDPNDPLPVSPSNLLTLREDVVPNIENFSTEDIAAYGKRRWRRVQSLAEEFWKRWQDDYVSSLTRRRKWLRASPNLKVGDIVIIKEQAPRCDWPMGRICKAEPDADGLVRKVHVARAAKGTRPSRTLERAVHQLVKLC